MDTNEEQQVQANKSKSFRFVKKNHSLHVGTLKRSFAGLINSMKKRAGTGSSSSSDFRSDSQMGRASATSDTAYQSGKIHTLLEMVQPGDKTSRQNYTGYLPILAEINALRDGLPDEYRNLDFDMISLDLLRELKVTYDKLNSYRQATPNQAGTSDDIEGLMEAYESQRSALCQKSCSGEFFETGSF